jgi:hypothetical protein
LRHQPTHRRIIITPYVAPHTTMPDLHIETIVSDLDALERGFLLGVLVAGGTDQRDVALSLMGPSADRCADAVQKMLTLPRADRVRHIGALAREALEPVPAGIHNVHPEILRALLDAESSDTIRLIATNAPSIVQAAATATLANRSDDPATESHAAAPAPDVISDLQRAVFAPIFAVPTASLDQRPQRWALRLLHLAPAELLHTLTDAGADLLGASLQGAPDDVLKRAAAHIEAPWSDRITRVAGDSAGSPDPDAYVFSRETARGLVAATPPAASPRQTLERLGARAIGHRLRVDDPHLAVALAQRLPPALAEQLEGVAQGG